MTHLSTLLIALRGIFANKLRSTLTVLGVILGIASVIALSSVGQGSSQMIKDRIGNLGTNLLTIRPGSANAGFVRGEQGSGQTLTYEDAQAMASAGLSAIKSVAPETSTRGQVIAAGSNANAAIYGETPEFLGIRNKKVASGEFINQSDIDNKTSVAVLGSAVAQQLFGTDDPIGQIVRINNLQFTVIGVMESVQGAATSDDDSIYVPITTVMYRLNPQRTPRGDHIVRTVYVEEVSSKKNDLAISQVTAFLQQRHDIAPGAADDFSILSQKDLMNTLTETSDTLTMLLTVTAAIALLVAGIGIMNIMLVSVTERTREIGIRKAVGAKRRNIMLQFLTEASAISVIGGLVGIGVGIGASHLLSGAITLNNSTIQTVITTNTIIVAFFVALGIGIVSGVYPAMRAARLNPIDALRYE